MYCLLAVLITAALLNCAQAAGSDTPLKCQELAKILPQNGQEENRNVSMNGKVVQVALYWGSDPSRAAAALLRALLTYVLRYNGVYLARGPHSTTSLATFVPFRLNYLKYDTLVIGVSTAWDINSEASQKWSPLQTKSCGLAGPRLMNFGRSTVAARCRLHGHLSASALALPACQQHVRWSFYSRTTARKHCDFFNSTDFSPSSPVPVLVVSNCSTALAQLKARVAAADVPLSMEINVDRATLLQHLRIANHSFLFLDYDIWDGEPNVTAVESPPCASVNFSCWQELDSAVAMRVGDIKLLEQYASHLMQYAYDFKPSSKNLRDILEREASGVHVEEAACELISNNTEKVSNYSLYYSFNSYWLAIYLCQDPNLKFYRDFINYFIMKLPIPTEGAKYSLNVKFFSFNCSSPVDLNTKLVNWKSYLDSVTLVGIVAQASTGASALGAVRGAVALHAPLLLVGLAPTAPGAWRISGTSRHLALALNRFVHDSNWNRVAILSETDPLADDCYTAFRKEFQFAYRDFKIPQTMTKAKAIEVLKELRIVTAYIILLNAGKETASLILSEAHEMQMRYEDGYVWILRDWQPDNFILNMTFFTLSFWRRSNDSISDDPELLIHKYNKTLDIQWPPLTASFVDAMFIMAQGFYELFTKYPETREDLRTPLTMRLQEKIFVKKPVKGLTQVLNLKEGYVEDTFVFVDKWRGATYQRLASWRVNVTADDDDAVHGPFTPPDDLPWYDGTTTCVVKTGDLFEPTCYDMALISVLLMLLLGVAVTLLIRRLLHQRVRQLIVKRQLEQEACREHIVSVLFAYLVSRDTVELRDELGAGRFGCVYLAQLRSSNSAQRFVAAKRLRDSAAPAEESEFLREACIMASLDHKHIVRLVGVSIDNGPSLVLMELAFFGDLLRYLRARRHLVEVETVTSETNACEESAHVSCEALTRLAREAAEALAYLSTRGLVHRDVRAANCLVDAHRSLKLADFGMARETRAGTDGAAEYACRRRGLFPVLWMAPESLKYGVFSAASDVWALGVLLLELVTLGERPYGTMSPLRVLQYVEAGGCPPLPLDASPHMRGVAKLCWRRTPEQRPSAREVATFLTAHPCALRPALLTTADPRLTFNSDDTTADCDSGLGESPSTELLPPSSPIDTHKSCQINTNCHSYVSHRPHCREYE